MAMQKAERKARLRQEEAEPPVLTRSIEVDDVEDGEARLIEVTEDERATIARLLDLVALDRLAFAYRLKREGEGRTGLTGTLSATATQTCVVTLEPVPSTLEVPVSAEFWPLRLLRQLEAKAQLEAKPDEPACHGMVDWPEPVRDGTIDLGPVIYESFATALDPYPRKEGADFAWHEEPSAESPAEKAPGPFAALGKLKRR
jgi:uncharacterized metal-binding protein YceD (DUF177 family)